MNSISERGNHAFRNDEGSAVLFAELETKGKYLQTAFTPVNYPAWEVGEVFLYGEDLQDHISYNLSGWYVDKCQLDINVTIGGVVIGADDIAFEIADRIDQAATDNDCNPAETPGALEDAVDEAATALGYTLTKKLRQDCLQEAESQLK